MKFTSFQIGIDLATSLAILVSAATFLWDQRKKQKIAKKLQLDNSVRAVTVERMQEINHDLSTWFVRDIVRKFQHVDNLTNLAVPELEKYLANKPKLLGDALNDVAATLEAITVFTDKIHAYKYQFYPLLDTIEGGSDQIGAFRKALGELMDKTNEISRGERSLMDELMAIIDYTKSNPIEQADNEMLAKYALSILADPDYEDWVNTFIPDEDKAAYWQSIQNTGSMNELERRILVNFINHVYENPDRLCAQVLIFMAARVVSARTQCKDFLVCLSAINFSLVSGPKTPDDTADTTLDKTINRYRSPAMFNSEREIR